MLRYQSQRSIAGSNSSKDNIGDKQLFDTWNKF